MTYEEAINLKEGDQVIRHEGGSNLWPHGEVKTVRRLSVYESDEEVYVYIQHSSINMKHTKLEIYRKAKTNYSIF